MDMVCKVAFGGDALTVLLGRATSPVLALLISFRKEARVCGLRLVIDVVEDGAYVLGCVLVGVTGLSACV